MLRSFHVATIFRRSHLVSQICCHPLTTKSTLTRPFSSKDNGNDDARRSTEASRELNRECAGGLGKSYPHGSTENLSGLTEEDKRSWLHEKFDSMNTENDVFAKIENIKTTIATGDTNVEESKSWKLDEEEKADVFDTQDLPAPLSEMEGSDDIDHHKTEQEKLFEAEAKELNAILKGKDRVFGDLVAASGITDEMLDTLIALKDFEGVEGLPSLDQIQHIVVEKNTRESIGAEIERQKHEELASARVRRVDEKGRAYGTGKRKCSIARVWIQPGNGKFIINDKEFDVYFPMLDHRAALLEPFNETKTLGLWNIKCTVKGGGFSGQVGAIRLGISRALQNWEPDFRPALRNAGLLTRDSRVVERKKPGKAKARKSFQWVKR